MDEFSQVQRAVWEAGDYTALSPYIAHVGERLVAAAGVEPGMRVLDVACGTGNAAIPAALAGADVTGLDLAPSLLAAGRAKASEHDVEIEWVEGDAQRLPFGDGTFDRVFSTFGHMFAPRHELTASEMRRVAGPGAVIGTATWTPEGTVGRLLAISAPYMPPPPPFADPPVLWGRADYVRERFPDAGSYAFEQHGADIEWDSLDGFLEVFATNFPPMVMAQRMLGDRFADLRAEIRGLWSQLNRARDGRLLLPQEYLQAVVRL